MTGPRPRVSVLVSVLGLGLGLGPTQVLPFLGLAPSAVSADAADPVAALRPGTDSLITWPDSLGRPRSRTTSDAEPGTLAPIFSRVRARVTPLAAPAAFGNSSNSRRAWAAP